MPFLKCLRRKKAATEAQSSPTGKEIHTPTGPKNRDRIKPQGMVIKNCLSSEIISECFPFPRASKVPEYMMPMVEIRNPRQIIRKAVTPALMRSSSASNREKICVGMSSDRSVPSNMRVAAAKRL